MLLVPSRNALGRSEIFNAWEAFSAHFDFLSQVTICLQLGFSISRSQEVMRFEVGMQFLNDFRILAIGVQGGTERMVKRMPTDTLR